MTGNGSGQAPGALAAEGTAWALQAGIEGVPVNIESVPLTVGGKVVGHFRIAESVGLMPLLKFAHAASSGLTEDSMEGMSAMYAMIRDCIHPGHECTCNMKPGEGRRHIDGCEYVPSDWDRFERTAIDSRAEGEDLMTVVETVMEVITARPTTPPSGSSPPDASSSPKSKRASPSRGSVVPPEARDLIPVDMHDKRLLSTA